MSLSRFCSLFPPLLAFTSCSPVSASVPRSGGKAFGGSPAITSNFPDPGWFVPLGGSISVAYSSSNLSSGVQVPIAVSQDFKKWIVLTGFDALNSPPTWAANGTGVFAPDASQLSDGLFVMYFSAQLSNSPLTYCIGAATSKTYFGNFTPLPRPIICPSAQGGAVDASGFQDHTGTPYVLYRLNGNRQSYTGPCGAPSLPSPIMIQQLDAADGTTPVGDPSEILASDPADGLPVGAPSMARMQSPSSSSSAIEGGWLYVLFYSRGCYLASDSAILYATSAGGVLNHGRHYEGGKEPLLQSGSGSGGWNMCAPASATVQTFSTDILWSARADGVEGGVRQVWTGKWMVDVESRVVSVSG